MANQIDLSKITSTKFVKNPSTKEVEIIQVISNGITTFVPICVGNSDYDELMRQVDAGELTIEPADE